MAAMDEYHKIETVFDRDENFRVVEGKLRLAEFGLIKDWLVTEKVDGTNVRVMYRSWRAGSGERLSEVTFGGKTDDAQMPTHLLLPLQRKFPVVQLDQQFRPKEDEQLEIVLYGEGYGPKIQKGGNYRTQEQGCSFRLFDVKVGDWWLNWDNVCNVASDLEIDTVPDMGIRTLEEAVRIARTGFESIVSEVEANMNYNAEGVVCRTDPLLFTRKGERLMWKLKAKDYTGGKH